MTEWFARPVLHVSSVEASLRFYVDRLGFKSPWRVEEDGQARVVHRSAIGADVVSYIHPGDHTMPEDAGALMVKFFKDHPAR